MSMRIAIVNDDKGNILVLSRILDEHSDHEIIWTAEDGAEALEKCIKDTPDIILMDLKMPVMNGIKATEAIMQQCPCAILIVTASVTGNASMVFEAMGAGAIDVVRTPVLGDQNIQRDTQTILQKISILQNLVTPFGKRKTSSDTNDMDTDSLSSNKTILVFGASTGGPAVLATILGLLPADFPLPVIIVQHVDQYFATSFAEWLDKQCLLPVRIAINGELPQAGKVLVAGTNQHLIMNKDKQLTYADSDEENHYKPSANVFFNSLVKNWDDNIIACLLTGMGRDGASGLMQIKQKGGYTITQDEDSCAVYGMPKAADEMGSSMYSLPPEGIAQLITELVENNNNNKKVEQA